MFSLGMVVYLYTAIDSTVATVVALTTGATAFFYVITNLLSVLYEVCPFGTQISHSTRRILKFIANHWTYAQRWKHLFVIKRSRSPHQTTEQELHALRWLAGHAQDPLVGDSAYHALAGFRSDSSPSNNSNAVLSPRDSAADPNAETPSPNSRDKAAITPGRKEKLITHMFVDVCQRMREEPTSGAHELEVSCGASVARFAATLPRLVNYLQPHSDRKLLIKLANERRRHLDLKPERFDPPKQALEALDAILDNTCPPFTADAYARITASELRLVTHIAGSLKSTRNSQPPMEWDSKSYQTRRNSNAVETAIGILTGVDPKHNSEVDIFELQARYSRSLARASFQMFFHSNDRASMSPFSLIGLLESLDKAAKCDDLNGTTRDGPNPTKQQLCTHHPQNSTAPTKLPDFNIFLVGAGDSYELRSGEIGNPCGLIAGILNVLGASSTRNVAAIEVAAANALNSVAPLLIRQLFGFTPTFTVAVEEPTSPKTDSIAVDDKMNKTSQYGIAGATATPSREIAAVPRSPGAPGSPLSRPPLAGASFRWDLNSYGWPIRDPIFSIAHWSLGQMIVLATFAKKHREVQGIGELSRLSLRAFNYRFQSCFPRSTAFTIAATYLRELKYLIDNFDTVDSNSSNSTDTESANAHLLQILALKEEKTVYSTYLADELGGPSQLLKIMQAALAPPATVEILLADISDAALSYWPYFSDPKDVDDQGLLRLLKLAEHQPYKLAVARCIFQIVRTAATLTAEHPGYPSITIDGLPAFFEATRFVLNYHESNPKKPLEMYNFVDNMFKVVRAFGSEHDEFIKNSIPRKEVKGFLKTMTKNTRLKTEVRNDWKRFGKPDDDDNQDEHTDPDHSKRKAVPDQRNVSEGHDQ
ncbi:hypothetical protein BDV93DRAFT_561170 [Ceratobasidium sp. AG-I]|nr:hypothetical protein BDV93DRAFT_561170 [Ceratobasidium sp. AG-I]